MASATSRSDAITLREATRKDAAGIAECWYRAFAPDPLNAWILPPTVDHPSYLAHFARTTRAGILKCDAKVMVASTKEGRVAGYVTYKEVRHGQTIWSRTISQRISYSVDVLVTAVLGFWRWAVYGEDHRVIDNRFEMIGEAQQAVLKRNKGYPGVDHYLYITWLAVHPDFQGRGVCSLMLQYGLNRGLPMYLEASNEGYPVYLHKGFEELPERLDIRREDGSLVESIPTMLHPGKAA